MAATTSGAPRLAVLLALVLAAAAVAAAVAGDEARAQSTYIVHLAPGHPALSTSLGGNFGAAVVFGLLLPRRLRAPPPRVIYTYTHAATGVAARLTAEQATHLAGRDGVLAVEPDQARQLHTTHTPAFLHLTEASGLLPAADGAASSVVVGVLDTGIYPIGRSSFAPASGTGLGPVPASFSGGCVSAGAFNASAYCNNKLVGAKYFSQGYEAALGHAIDETAESKSPLDTEGHGTHTASTAAGSPVAGAGYYEYAKGQAVGMAPGARVAAYKICWASGCFDSDILAAFDEAVADGVDVISLSVGANGYAPTFPRDSIAIGAFHAVRKGIVVSCSAGNSGPGEYTAVNIAPWILTVGASTVDREFPADVVLGDGSVFGGVSLYSGDPLNTSQLLPVAYAADCGSRLCVQGELDPAKVAGKMVLCERGGNARVAKGAAVKQAGGVGMILANTEESGEELIADSHLVPATMVGQMFGDKIRHYVQTDPSPTATIAFRGTVIGKSPSAPRVASFSSRGPNYRAHEILKPDVIAPGVNILAAWTGAASPTDLDIDPRRVEFNIISGTSMSCPHVSGLAALLRQAHPGWSPAAIKSALMTTAYNVDNAGETIKDLATGVESTPFVRGAGHVDPNSAFDPGLVYDAGTDDYIAFLCALGYARSQIAVFTGDGTVPDCSTKLARSGDLNYPAFAAVFSSYKDSVTYHRVVRNVGSNASAVYDATVHAPAGVDVAVTPSKLVFDDEHQSLAYEITLAASGNPVIVDAKYSFGSVTWSDGAHDVTCPIAVTWPSNGEVAAM